MRPLVMRFSISILLLDVNVDHLHPSFCQCGNRRIVGVRLQSFDYGVDASTHKIIFECYDLWVIIGPERMQNFVQAIDQRLFCSRLADSSCRLLAHRFNSRVLLEYEIFLVSSTSLVEVLVHCLFITMDIAVIRQALF